MFAYLQSMRQQFKRLPWACGREWPIRSLTAIVAEDDNTVWVLKGETFVLYWELPTFAMCTIKSTTRQLHQPTFPHFRIGIKSPQNKHHSCMNQCWMLCRWMHGTNTPSVLVSKNLPDQYQNCTTNPILFLSSRYHKIYTYVLIWVNTILVPYRY